MKKENNIKKDMLVIDKLVKFNNIGESLYVYIKNDNNTEDFPSMYVLIEKMGKYVMRGGYIAAIQSLINSKVKHNDDLLKIFSLLENIDDEKKIYDGVENMFGDGIVDYYHNQFTKDRLHNNKSLIRTLSTGVLNNINDVIHMSKIIGGYNNTYPMNYLPCITCGLFSHWAINGIDVIEFPYLLMLTLKKNEVKIFILGNTINNFNIENEYVEYINQWTYYIRTKLDYIKENKKIRSHENILSRIDYIHNNFNQYMTAIITSYDAILMSNGYFESLYMLASFHNYNKEILTLSTSLFSLCYDTNDIDIINSFSK